MKTFALYFAVLVAFAAAVPSFNRIDTRQLPSGCSGSNSSQCYPSGFDAVPTTLIQCIGSVCSCSDCFTQNATTGKCSTTIPNCYFYSPTSGTCTDNRKSQLTAFLLSIFLADFGVANFFIGQTGLGAGQLILFLSVFVLVICIIISGCCICGCTAADCGVMAVIPIILIVISIILIVCVSLSVSAWWIADAVIFGTNTRLDGDGCPLQPWGSQ